MTDRNETVSEAGTVNPQQAKDGPLTEPQQAFAKLLGSLLARRWQQEQTERTRPEPAEEADH